MAFSELKAAADDFGLSFDDEKQLLFGEKNGYGVVIADSGDIYDVRIFCVQPYKNEAAVINAVTSLAESLPKNTMRIQSCEYGYVHAALEKYTLLQEKIVYLIEFLEKLAAELKRLGIAPDAYQLPKQTKKNETAEIPKNAVKIKLGFDARSILGLLGAVLGAIAVIVISVMTISIPLEADAFGNFFEISVYAVPVAACGLVFFDYIFLARKLDAFGIIICTLLTLAAVYLSAFGTAVRTITSLESGTSAGAVIADFQTFLGSHEAVDNFMMRHTTESMIFAALGALVFIIYYFRKHPKETVDSEKYIITDEKKHKQTFF